MPKSRRRSLPDYQAIRDGFERAGIDRDFYNGDDLDELWRRCHGNVERIVQAAVAHAAQLGTTKAGSIE